MTKLITAKEAFALSNFDINIDGHIDYINQQVRGACKNHNSRTTCLLDGCSYKTAIKIAVCLRNAGYCFKWHMMSDNIACFNISWGGS